MKKILFIVPSLTQTNGVSAFLFNYLANMNLNKFNITILSSKIRPSDTYLNFAKKHNVDVYLTPDLREDGIIKYNKSINDFFQIHHDFDLIYSNVVNQFIFVLRYAKKYGINNYALHSHATSTSDTFFKRIINNTIKKIILKKITYKLACSTPAGKTLFGNDKFQLVYNAIDYSKFKFSTNYRTEIRKKYNIKNENIIVGFVGRFAPVKNIFFFIELAKRLNVTTKILMIGTGSQKKDFVNKIEKEKISDKFILIEECDDVYKYYSAMDIFLLPSIYEGLPVVAIEAQANGLKCLISDTVTDECKILSTTTFLNRNDYNRWVQECNKVENRNNRRHVVLNSKFDIQVQCKKYEDLLNNMCK